MVEVRKEIFMEEILKVDYDKQTVSARGLHERLNIGTEFRKWFPRMCEYGFAENEDYERVSQKCPTLGGEQTMVDYELSLDMAKQICMIQRTPEGKECRQYLIDLEKAWNTPEQVMARALKVAERTILSLNTKVLEMQPKADYFDELVDRNLLTNFRDTAKELGVKESFFINWLLEKNYIYRDCKGKLQPYAASMDKGLFEIKEFSSRYSNHAGTQTLVTPKGRETFGLLLGKEK